MVNPLRHSTKLLVNSPGRDTESAPKSPDGSHWDEGSIEEAQRGAGKKRKGSVGGLFHDVRMEPLLFIQDIFYGLNQLGWGRIF